MLTRLQVKGFKNLRGLDIRLGPFTCIAGANGVGKSNLFDAIHFLSHLSHRPLHEAASMVRDDTGRFSNISNLFSSGGGEKRMEFVADMIVPRQASDDFNQKAEATTAFLQYTLHLVWIQEESRMGIEKEELTPLSKSPHLGFTSNQKWKKAVMGGSRAAGTSFLSTGEKHGERVINRHQDGGSRGQPQPIPAGSLPRTVLSGSNATESPTALCARREMESWLLLQLEPSSLRESDPFSTSPFLTANGGQIPATLHRLVKLSKDPEAMLQRLSNRLRDLVPEIRNIGVDEDIKREVYTLQAAQRDGTLHDARSLSDGTLRFLALAILESDPKFSGLVCFEEPENGIHPERIKAIVDLLYDIATDPEDEPEDKLRQVIVNTHSPIVVLQVPDDSLLIARTIDDYETRRQGFGIACLTDTWRANYFKDEVHAISFRAAKGYFNPVLPSQEEWKRHEEWGKNRVADREDARQLDFRDYDPNK